MKLYVLAAILAVSAFHAPDAMAARRNVGSGLVGNTVELTGPAGTTKIYYRDHKTLVVRAPDGTKSRGWWRVKGKSICTKIGEKPESCTAPIADAPVAGNFGVISGGEGEGELKWTITRGRGF